MNQAGGVIVGHFSWDGHGVDIKIPCINIDRTCAAHRFNIVFYVQTLMIWTYRSEGPTQALDLSGSGLL